MVMLNLEQSTITYPSLAKLLGVNRGTTWNWATGRVRPSRLVRQRLAALGVIIVLPPKRKRL